MRCSKAKKLISEYIDGNLEARQNARLEQHFDICPDCQKLSKDFQKIVEGTRELEKLTPSPQAWLRMKEKLTTEEQKVFTLQPKRKERFSFLPLQPKLKYAFSSALVLAIIVGAVTFGFWYWKGRAVPGNDDLQKYTLAKLDEAERHYQLAVKALWEAVTAQEGKMDPKVAEVFQRNLKIVDSSISACKQAVLQDPENIEARNYLLAAYREKVDFLDGMMGANEKSSQKRELGITL